MLDTVPYRFMGGQDRSITSLLANRQTLYTLKNLRQRRGTQGLIEQVPYWKETIHYAQGTYWNGSASTTEHAGSSLRMITPHLTVTDYVIRVTGGIQLQVFYQTTAPTAETIYTGCRLVINNIVALGITLGSTLDVEMTGAAAFRWRKNGGGWTAGVPSTAGVSIDGGSATLYFLANTGFAGTETWVWTRSDASYANSAQKRTRPCEYAYYKDNLYFTAVDDRLMVYDLNYPAPAYSYAISAGYRPIYCSAFTFYYDHLVCAAYSTTSTSYALRGTTIGWSDVTDIHCFVPTDTNEADTYTIPAVSKTGSFNTNQTVALGVAVLKQQLFVFTNSEIYVTSYLGLPLVFSFVKYDDTAINSTSTNPIVVSRHGVFIIAIQDIIFFDGSGFQSIGAPVLGAVFSFGAYHNSTDELNLVAGDGLLYVYQRHNGCWYTRNAVFSARTIRCLGIYSSTSILYAGTNILYANEEDTGFTQQPLTLDGSNYAVPTICMHLVGNLSSVPKELTGVYPLLYVTAVSSTYYSTSTDLQLTAYWEDCPSGVITEAKSTSTNAVWTTASVNSPCPLPRLSFRQLSLEFRGVGLVSGKPPAQMLISGFELVVFDSSARVPAK